VLTFFSIPKAFTGHIGIIQRNAIRSWLLLHPDVEIILFGSDEGTVKVAREFSLRHEPSVERNEFGTILIDSVFAKAQSAARHDVLCYVNCDILLMGDFRRALARVTPAHREFLMVGQRWDVDVAKPLSFERPDWQGELRTLALSRNKKRPAEWIDYFVFSRGLYGPDMPPFAVGRTSWDNWLVWKALESRKPVVDASPVVMAVHQNHDYNHHPQGEHGAWHGAEADRNAELAGRSRRTVADATLVLTDEGERPNLRKFWEACWRWVQPKCKLLWFAVLDVTRPLRSALGLRSARLRRSHGKA
jgi:hypothetical protein